MNKKRIAKNSTLTTPLFCLLVAGNLVGCETDVEEETFDIESYKVTSKVSDGGTVDLSDKLVNEGEIVSITLIPDEGYELESISGCEGQLVESVYTTGAISASCEVDVSYMLERIVVSIKPSTGGEVDLKSQLINPGSKAIFNLTANEGFDIGEVTGCEGALEDGMYTTSAVSTACEVSATFVEQTFEVTTEVSAGGTIDLATQTITYGKTASISLTPDNLFEIGTVSGCEGSLTDNIYTTAGLTDVCSITVEFAEKDVLLTGLALTSLSDTVDDVNTMQYTAIASFSNTKTKEVGDKAIWTSSDLSIATIDDNGLVTPLKSGDITVSVSYTDTSGTSTDEASLTVTPSLKIIGDFGGSAFAARKTDGTVITWGHEERGGLSTTVVEKLIEVDKIFTNKWAFAAIKNDGTVVSWGHDDTAGNSSAIETQLTDVVDIVSNDYAFAAIKADGTVVTWGDDTAAPKNRGGVSSDVQAQLTDVVSVTSNPYGFAAIKADGTVVTWGYEGRGHTTDSDILEQLVGVTKVVSNYRGFTALKGDGTVVSWGYDSYIEGYVTARDAGKLTNIKDITSNLYAFSAIKSDGSVVAWGYEDRGGDPKAAAESLVDVVSIDSTRYTFAALKKDGTVVSWGDAAYGGNSDTVSASLTDVASITHSYKAYAALKNDGTVITWGNEEYGGNSGAVTADLVNIVSVTAGYNAFAALKEDGTVVVWGNLNYGATTIDDVDTSALEVPLTGVTALYANRYAFVAIKADGSVVTWGYAERGGNSSAVSFE